jgi:hypothetical protein
VTKPKAPRKKEEISAPVAEKKKVAAKTDTKKEAVQPKKGLFGMLKGKKEEPKKGKK